MKRGVPPNPQSVKQVAVRLGRSEHTMRAWCVALDIPTGRGVSLSPVDIARLEELQASGGLRAVERFRHVSITLPETLVQLVEEERARRGWDRSTFIREAIRDYIAKLYEE